MISLAPLLSNQMVTGGLALGVAGGAIASLRKVPEFAIEAVKRQFIISVQIRSQGLLYYWLREWLDAHEYSRKSRDVFAQIDYKWNDNSAEPRIQITPAAGDHIIRYKGRRIWLNREQTVDKTFGAVTEVITLKMIGRDQAIIRDLLSDIERVARSDEGRQVAIWISRNDEWSELTKKPPRPLSTVILPNDEGRVIVEDLTRFYSERDWYTERGLPHRRGYLFYGPPGSGKSSLTAAIAGELKKDLYVLNLAAKEMDDNRLSTLMSKVPERGIVLIEDVDSAFTERDKSDEHASHVTFSGLLNAIDGVGARDGQVIVLSTNHVERLDPALIRPGRVDYRMLLDNASTSQVERLFASFFPDEAHLAAAFARRVGDKTASMASLQGHLVSNRLNANAAIEKYR